MQHNRLDNVIRRNRWATLKDSALTSSLLAGTAWGVFFFASTFAAI